MKIQVKKNISAEEALNEIAALIKDVAGDYKYIQNSATIYLTLHDGKGNKPECNEREFVISNEGAYDINEKVNNSRLKSRACENRRPVLEIGY